MELKEGSRILVMIGSFLEIQSRALSSHFKAGAVTAWLLNKDHVCGCNVHPNTSSKALCLSPPSLNLPSVYNIAHFKAWESILHISKLGLSILDSS